MLLIKNELDGKKKFFKKWVMLRFSFLIQLALLLLIPTS